MAELRLIEGGHVETEKGRWCAVCGKEITDKEWLYALDEINEGPMDYCHDCYVEATEDVLNVMKRWGLKRLTENKAVTVVSMFMDAWEGTIEGIYESKKGE